MITMEFYLGLTALEAHLMQVFGISTSTINAMCTFTSSHQCIRGLHHCFLSNLHINPVLHINPGHSSQFV